MAISMLSDFEIWLRARDLWVPSRDRTGDPDEARLYGSEYYDLEDAVTGIIEDKCSVDAADDIIDELKVAINKSLRGKYNADGISLYKGLRSDIRSTLRDGCPNSSL